MSPPDDGPRSPEQHAREHLVDVVDSDRVLECSQLQRQLRFQHLVRHYMAQILHGCKSAYCTTPTCLSSQKRTASRPLRPPTQLTARALAHYLAGQDNPQRGLCPHELKMLPSSLEIPGTRDFSLQPARNRDQQRAVYNEPLDLKNAPGDVETPQQHIVNAIKERHQAKMDAKSLSQNLYDSVTMIYAYSKQLPTLESMFYKLRSVTGSQSSASNSSPCVTSATFAHDDVVMSPVNIQIDRRQSHNHSQLSSVSPEVLSNGQHVYRIPFHVREYTTTKTSSVFNVMGRTTSPPLLPTNVEGHPAPMASADPILPVLSTLNCSTLEELKNNVYTHRKDCPNDSLNSSVDYDTNRRFQPSTPFVNRSLFYTLSNTETLLKSFHDPTQAFARSRLWHLDSARLTHSFRDWSRHNGALVYDSLCIALEALFTSPPELHVQKSPRLAPSRKGTSVGTLTQLGYLDILAAAHIVMICIHALTSSVSVGWPHTWAQLRRLRAWGVILPNAPSGTDQFAHPYLEITDELEYEPAIRLAENLLRAIGARTCFEHILATMKKQQGHHAQPDTLVKIIVGHLVVTERVAIANKQRMTPDYSTKDDPGWTVTATLMEWLKTVIIKRWDSKAEINKWSSVGTAVLLLREMFSSRTALQLRDDMFEIPFFNERLDVLAEPVKFLSFEEQPNTCHILQFPFLFPIKYLVKYFRTINFTTMTKQYDHATRTRQMEGLLAKYLQPSHSRLVWSTMKLTLDQYFFLYVSREDPLTDTLDQLWGLEQRVLLKPLKVKMGHDEGELGVDQGGVTYEFFRVVLSEAFKAHHGMFTVDPQTRMIWFQPGTLEPDWKFEMIGVLFSLAIYNGVTLPVTMPLALYNYLLLEKAFLYGQATAEDSLDSIRDGWPDLTKSLEALLSWTDGDVSDTFGRDYVFSYEAFGHYIDHNMEEPYIRPQKVTTTTTAIRPEDIPDCKTTQAKSVTNENRRDFVKDYVHHLTYLSVSSQLHAFRKGFYACLNPRSIELFFAEKLRNLVEGEQDIDISKLRGIATYETYSSTDPPVKDFWNVVEGFSQDDRRSLLEFVTASDRVPVTGYESLTFHITRGVNPALLPESHTCFGGLTLPPYPNEEVLREKLLLALEHAKGFGVA